MDMRYRARASWKAGAASFSAGEKG
jgi:hypothetical protein